MAHYQLSHVNESSASISFRGIPYADFDRTGHWSVWCISKMFEASRILSMYKGFLCFRQIDGREAGMVIVKQRLRLNPKLHKMDLKSQTKLQFDLELLQIGETSLSFITKFTDGMTGEILGENPLKYVRMSRKTRRAIPFPDFIQEKFSSFSNPNIKTGLQKERLPDTPASAFKYDVIPSHSDTDRNEHVNQSSYIKFCMDCATHASLNGYYAYFHSDICLYPSVEWIITYIGESVANDELEIFTWQDPTQEEKIYFSIAVNKKVIFHAAVLFDKTLHHHRIVSNM